MLIRETTARCKLQTKRVEATVNTLTCEFSFSTAAAASFAVDIVTNANPLFLPSFPLIGFPKQPRALFSKAESQLKQKKKFKSAPQRLAGARGIALCGIRWARPHLDVLDGAALREELLDLRRGQGPGQVGHVQLPPLLPLLLIRRLPCSLLIPDSPWLCFGFRCGQWQFGR